MNARSALVLFAALAALRHSVWCRKAPETVEKNYAISRPIFGAHVSSCVLVWEGDGVVWFRSAF